MPWLDLSDVIIDPFLADNFAVIRRMQSVSQHGETLITIMGTFSAIGVITPTGNNSLVRADAYESQADSIQIITMFRLRGAAQDVAGINWQPDLVQWNGNTYQLKTLNDFTRFGAGFVQAEGIAIDYNPSPDAEFNIVPPMLNWSLARNSGLRLMGWA